MPLKVGDLYFSDSASADSRLRFYKEFPLYFHIKDNQGRYLFYTDAVALEFRLPANDWLRGKTDADLVNKGLMQKEVAENIKSMEKRIIRSGKPQWRDDKTAEGGIMQSRRWPVYEEGTKFLLGIGTAIQVFDENGESPSGFSLDPDAFWNNCRQS